MNESLLDLDMAHLQALLASLGAPAYRAKQVQRWIYSGMAVALKAAIFQVTAFSFTW